MYIDITKIDKKRIFDLLEKLIEEIVSIQEQCEENKAFSLKMSIHYNDPIDYEYIDKMNDIIYKSTANLNRLYLVRNFLESI